MVFKLLHDSCRTVPAGRTGPPLIVPPLSVVPRVAGAALTVSSTEAQGTDVAADPPLDRYAPAVDDSWKLPAPAGLPAVV
jgi:hypothetical protein